MIITQSYVVCKLFCVMQDLVERLGAEYSGIEYTHEVTPDGETFVVGHDERYVCLKVTNGIELSTWRRMWGRNMEEMSYRLDAPSEELEIDYIVFAINGLCERLLRNPYMSVFDGIFIPDKEAKNG